MKGDEKKETDFFGGEREKQKLMHNILHPAISFEALNSCVFIVVFIMSVYFLL